MLRRITSCTLWGVNGYGLLIPVIKTSGTSVFILVCNRNKSFGSTFIIYIYRHGFKGADIRYDFLRGNLQAYMREERGLYKTGIFRYGNTKTRLIRRQCVLRTSIL